MREIAPSVIIVPSALSISTNRLPQFLDKISDIIVMGDKVTFKANFPFDGTTFDNGLTITALTTSAGPFANANAVSKVTYAGPGLIEIN